jgi:MFS family permease
VILRALSTVVANLRGFFAHRLARTVGLTFAFDNLMFGSWVTHIPHVKQSLGLNDAGLGLALFGMPLGLLAMNPFSARLIARFGLPAATVGSLLATLAAFALPLWMPDRWTLMAALFLIGVGVALLNVAMNTCATAVEQAQGIFIMSSCHGMWSLGGLVGSGTSALLIAAGVAPVWHMTALALGLAVLTAVVLLPVLRSVPERPAEEAVGLSVDGGLEELGDVPPPRAQGQAKFVLPNRDLLLMIFIGLCVSMSEGVAFDWSAVYLRDHLGAPAQIAALAITVFSLTMMGMRFTGDVLIPRFGERRLLAFSAGLTIVALAVAITASGPAQGLLGFFLLGAGVALGAPILFNAAARVPGLAPGAGLATYATFSFIGFLAGPPAVGYIGEHFGLPVALACIAALVALSLLAIRAVRLS